MTAQRQVNGLHTHQSNFTSPATINNKNNIIHMSSVLLWRTNNLGHLIFANMEYMHYFGLKLGDSLAKVDWPVILHHDDRREYIRELMRATIGRHHFHARARVKHHDGSWRWIESRANPQYDMDGNFQGLVGSSPEITDLVEAFENLKMQDQNKSNYLNDLSREISDPLNVIKSTMSLLNIKNDDKRNKVEHLMANEMVLLTKLINALTDLTERETTQKAKTE